MNDKKPMIDSPRQIPLLEQEKIEEIDIIYKRRRGRRFSPARLKKIYFLSAMLFFALAVVIVFLHVDFSMGDKNIVNDTDKGSDTIAEESREISNDTEVMATLPAETEPEPEDKKPITLDKLYSFDYSLVPENASPILPMDLSMSSSGTTYMNNFTGLIFDANALLSKKINGSQYDMLSASEAPKVLIVHTHATEAYSEDGAIFYDNDSEELARSSDNEENVVSLGKLMSDILNQKGIPTVHCAVMHDSVQTKDSYSRSEKSIREYLMKYPSIEIVIDLHRDSIMKSDGSLIRPVTLVDSEAVAQVMCVVGSDWAGEACPRWQDNLSLALKLRERLNTEYTNICRPTELHEYTYNQEISRYALTIEIGSSGNSLVEAKRAVEIVSHALAGIVAEM